MTKDTKAPDFIPIGKIVGAFGIDGRMKVEVLTDFPERFDLGRTIYLNGEDKVIRWVARHKSQVRLKLDGFAKPEQVEDLVGTPIEILAGDRPDLAEDQYYTADLIGMRVVTDEGEDLGELEEVLPFPAHDVLVVNDILIPAIEEFIKLVDFETNSITVHLIPGMRGEEV